MGTGCSSEASLTAPHDKSQSNDGLRKMTRIRDRARKTSTTSSSDINLKVTKPRKWVQPLPTPMPKVIPYTPELSQLTVEDNGANLSVATHFSGSDALSVTGSSRSTNNLTVSSSTSMAPPFTPSTSRTPRMKEHLKLPPRLKSLDPELQHLLLGHEVDLSTLVKRPKVIHLKVIAPGEECMKERLALWTNALMPLRVFSAENGYTLDIQDDLWSSANLSTISTNLLILQGNGYFQLNKTDCEKKIEDTLDVVLIILAEVYRYRLPALLSHEEYTLIVVSLPDSATTAIFHELYSNNDNLSPPSYELSHRVMIKQEEARLRELVQLMVNVFKREHKNLDKFNSDYYNQVRKALHYQDMLVSNTVVVSKSYSCTENTCKTHHVNDGAHHTNSVLPSVKNKFPPENVIQLSVSCEKNNENDKIKSSSDEDSTRLVDMSVAVKEKLEQHLTKVFELRNEESRVIATGVPHCLIEELLTQNMFCAKCLSSAAPLLESSTLTNLMDYLNTVTEKPAVLYAEPGWGLSTAWAQMVRVCRDSLPNSVMIYRSIGLSPESYTLISVLLSIQQQLDVILGSSTGRKENKQNPVLGTLLKDIVTRSTSHMPIIILLEGIQLSSSHLQELESMLLTESLPTTTKLLVMTSDKDVSNKLSAMMKDVVSVTAAPWTKNDVVDIFKRNLSMHKCSLTDTQQSAVVAALETCPLPMYASISAKLASDWTSLTKVCSEDLPDSLEGIVSRFFHHLEQSFPSDCFSFMMACLTGTFGGISIWEMSDLLSVNDSALLSIYSDVKDPPIHRAPPVVWKYISIYLTNYLCLFTSQDFYTYSWSSGCLRQFAANKYFKGSVSHNLLHSEIVDYFFGRWAGKKKPYPDPEEEIELLQDRFIMPQPESFGKHLNTRRFMCLPYHVLHCEKNSQLAWKMCIFNLPWIEKKIKSTSVLQVVCDLEFAKSLEMPLDSEVNSIQQLILQSDEYLRVDGREVYKCLQKCLPVSGNIDKNVKNEELKSFYMCLAKPPGAFLYPIDEIDVSPAELYNSSHILPVIDSLIPVSTDTKEIFVAAALRSEGEIKVIDIVKNKCVRTLTGVDHPQTLVMLETTIAVVLCNRELYVIDLDCGKVVTKLRSVLNLKMPFFGLQNKESIVVLSRDRMVVNILSIKTGGITATFKAGEARFLDSLIISRDGSILVCGDETQKPFPLLVWSLEHCKLLHDIRMSQHEFLTNLADITDNGQYIACGCREVNDSSNFIVVYDLESGHLFKKFKMAASCTALAVSSVTMSVVAGLDTGQLVVWDIVSGNQRFIIDGAQVAIDKIVLTPDGKNCLTFCKKDFSISSHTLCLWNLDSGHYVAGHTFDSCITCAHLCPDGRMVLVGIKGLCDPVRLLLVPQGTDFTTAKEEWEKEKSATTQVFGDLSRHEATINLDVD